MYFNLEHKHRVENRGDNYTYIGTYKCNEITIDGKKSKSHIRVKCPYCGKEYDVELYSFARGNKSKCNYCCNSYENSFAYYIQVELGESLNKYWNWEKNTVNPYLINKNINKKDKKIWIYCDKVDYHNDLGGYETTPYAFTTGGRCPYCHNFKVHPKDSFAQYDIDILGKDFLDKYWSNKNTINPWNIKPHSDKKVWILCQEKDYHNDEGGYEIRCDHFNKGVRCTYCGSNGKIHPKDSFGALYPEKAKYWSENNDKSPFEVASHTHDKYNFICEKCGKEFERNMMIISRSNVGIVCNNCNSSVLEKNTSKILDKYNVKYYREYIFNDLIGVGNNNLRFDFYLPDYNLLIECQGVQHKEWQKTWMSKEEFKIILEHDKRKRNYCKNNNIKLLEIWYYEIDDIEEILEKELK